jgi:nucleotide-binding universal stress UspA family protein
MHRILAATDFSPAAGVALEHAATLALRAGAELRLLHVLPLPLTPALAPETAVTLPVAPGLTEESLAAQALNECASGLRARGLEVSVSTPSGQPAEAIVAEAAVWHADLVVVGTRGHSAWRNLLLGSTAEQVVERAECPVLAVHAGDAPHEAATRRVLVATDFSATARAATRRAIALLGLTDRDTLVLAHVVRQPAPVASAVPPYTGGEIHALVRSESMAELVREAEGLRPVGLAPQVELLDGHPPTALAAAARELDADLIVIGTRGLSGFAHLLLGSTAERLVQSAQCPVLVVPPAPMALHRGAAFASRLPVELAQHPR